MMPAFSKIAEVIAMGLGVAGFGLSLTSYLRDRHHLRVGMEWYLPNTLTSEYRGYVRVMNEGRRGVQIRRVGLVLPSSEGSRYMPLHLAPIDRRVAEGESANYYFSLSDLGISIDWQEIGGFAEDYANKLYISRNFTDRK